MDTDLAQLVSSSIRDVLATVGADEAAPAGAEAPSTSAADLGNYTSVSAALSGAFSDRSPADEPAPGPGPGSLDTGLLDVPNNAAATIRLLKTRVQSLEQQLQALLQQSQERDAQLAELQREARQFAQKEATWQRSQKALEAQVERHRRTAEAAREALGRKETELKEQAAAGVKADKDRRAAEADGRAREVRLTRALEEVERYKALLMDVKAQEREGKDVAKGEARQLAIDKKRLERQRAELLGALRKQGRLVEVLQRQKAHLEAARALAFTEAEFMRVIELGGAGGGGA